MSTGKQLNDLLSEIAEMIYLRETARTNKFYDVADQCRDSLEILEVTIQDRRDKPSIYNVLWLPMFYDMYVKYLAKKCLKATFYNKLRFLWCEYGNLSYLKELMIITWRKLYKGRPGRDYKDNVHYYMPTNGLYGKLCLRIKRLRPQY